MAGKLYLIPSTLGDTPTSEVIPEYVTKIINTITRYIVENERSGRRMLLQLGLNTPVGELTFHILDEHTNKEELPLFLEDAANADIGLLSEAGVPAIADPGNDLIKLAHERNMEVIPLVGPSSILMAMMASGLNGQNFAFNGYLPVKSLERIKKIKFLEQRSQSENQSQIFIETPYRNNQLVADILAACNNDTLLCIATDITTSHACIKTQPVIHWKKVKTDIHKRPSIFIIHKNNR